MLGEIIMQIPDDEMKRACQIYMDTVFKVPIEVTSVKQVRTKNRKNGRFEIKFKEGKVDEDVQVLKPGEVPQHKAFEPPTDDIDKANAEASQEAKEIVEEKPTGGTKRKLTLEEIRNSAGNTPNTGT